MSNGLEIFIILGFLLLAQSVQSLRDGYRFLRYVLHCRSEPPGDYAPPAAVIIPVKGMDSGLENNVSAFLHQDYPQYQVILVVDDEKDPAFPKLNALVKEAAAQGPGKIRNVSLLIAGLSHSQGQKVHNLLKGLEIVNPGTEVLAFADADARPDSQWLRSLVAPLVSPDVTVSTGFRWYLPGKTFVSQLRAAWDTSVATLMGEDDSSFPWGGSMAIRKAEFERLQIGERYWRSTVSDDYGLGKAVRDRGGRIRFEPRCLVASREDSTFAELMHWTNRQIIITRVYAARLWWLGMGAYLLYSGAFISGLIVLFNPSTVLLERCGVVALLTVILWLGMAKGQIRAVLAREMFPGEREDLAKYGKCYWQLTPLVPWVMLCNFVVAGFVRTIEWRGVRYRLRSDHGVEITGRGKD